MKTPPPIVPPINTATGQDLAAVLNALWRYVKVWEQIEALRSGEPAAAVSGEQIFEFVCCGERLIEAGVIETTPIRDTFTNWFDNELAQAED